MDRDKVVVQGREILLHVGHVKTGSSYLQSVLALSQARLIEEGLCYPDSPRTAEAKSGRISSGNYRLPEIVGDLGRWEHMFGSDVRGLIFSSEFLFDEILQSPEVLHRFRDAGLEPRILLFIRDPLEIIGSAYGQAVKRGGYTGTIDDYIGRIDFTHSIPGKVRDFIRLCEDAGVTLSLRNYSSHKRDLSSALAAFLGVDASLLARPPSGSVNRSLTAAELAFQRRLNEGLDRKLAGRFADAMCNGLPDIRSDMPLPSANVLRRLTTNLNAEIEATNAVIMEETERYSPLDLDSLLTRATVGRATYEFSEEQLGLLAETFIDLLTGGKAARERHAAEAGASGWLTSLLGQLRRDGRR